MAETDAEEPESHQPLKFPLEGWNDYFTPPPDGIDEGIDEDSLAKIAELIEMKDNGDSKESIAGVF